MFIKLFQLGVCCLGIAFMMESWICIAFFFHNAREEN